MGYCYSFTRCLVMRIQMPHKQIPVPLRIPVREVQRSQRRLWKEWVKGAALQFWVRRARLCRLPSPNILAISRAGFGVLPLNRSPFVTVKSKWTPCNCLQFQASLKFAVSPLVSFLSSFLS